MRRAAVCIAASFKFLVPASPISFIFYLIHSSPHPPIHSTHMSLFGQIKRHNPTKPRRSPLPTSAWDEDRRFGLSGPSAYSRWFTILYIPLPFGRPSDSHSLSSGSSLGSPRSYHAKPRARHLKIYLPIPPRLYARIPRLNSPIRVLFLLVICAVVGFFLLGFRKTSQGERTWSPPFVDPDTMVITPEEAAMVWEWEILSGHYPSTEYRMSSVVLPSPHADCCLAPDHLPLSPSLKNPVVPATLLPSPSTPTPLVAYQNRADKFPSAHLAGNGPERHYLSVWDMRESQPGFPARPMPGSIMDLDLVLEKCDFGTNKVSYPLFYSR